MDKIIKKLFFLLLTFLFFSFTFSLNAAHIAWHPSGKLFAVNSEKENINIYAFNEGQALLNFSITKHAKFSHSALITSLAWHPNGEFLASTSEDNTIKIWHWNGAEASHSYSIFKFSDPNCIAWDLGGEHLIVNTLTSVQMYEWNGLQARFLQNIHYKMPQMARNSSFSSIKPTKDLIDYNAKKISSFFLLNGEKLFEVDNIFASAWHPHDDILATKSSKHVRIFKWTNQKLISLTSAMMKHKDEKTNLAWDNEGKIIAYWSNNNLVMWKFNGQSMSRVTNIDFYKEIMAFSFDPMSEFVVLLFNEGIQVMSISSLVSETKKTFLNNTQEKNEHPSSPLNKVKRRLSQSAKDLSNLSPRLPNGAKQLGHNLSPRLTQSFYVGKESKSSLDCPKCNERKTLEVLTCNHSLCEDCYLISSSCPLCKEPLMKKVKVFFSPTLDFRAGHSS